MAEAALIIPDRLAAVQERGLTDGAHDDWTDGACAMEAVAYITGEAWSDSPDCVCPVIASFMRSWNDALPDEDRTTLLMPLIVKTVGTRGSRALEERRSLMAADWLVRTHTPAWLQLAGLTAQADALRSLPEITSMAQVPSIREPIEAARRDAAAARAAGRDPAWDPAWAAAWAAAGAAVGAAAGAAARAAARAAVGDPAWAAAWAAVGDPAWAAAWAAARAAARAAVGDPAWAAARAAAWDALANTRRQLQASAADLIERMCVLADAA